MQSSLKQDHVKLEAIIFKGTMRRYCLFEWSHLSLLRNQNKPQVI